MEQVRETETWMPMKTTQTAAAATHHDHVESSGGGPNHSDFGFTDDEDDEDYDSYDHEDDDEEQDDFSGSGDRARRERQQDPGGGAPARPTIDEVGIVRDSNEVPLLRNEPGEEQPSNVLMSHASDDSIFSKTEVLAALIAGGAVGLMFAVLLILLLIYRMKKKDEGSYDLGKKPIYKKAPTTEIYA
ncbi:Syndecan-4 Precursor [Larimichthys crocea]|uniref:Syndecan n=1 Tax=Larimichthys crocea TaxID=215358 RepID=A0A6G0J5B0_LARCR|nr:Syndecan-4 Precursor [Larimichthys crocea]